MECVRKSPAEAYCWAGDADGFRAWLSQQGFDEFRGDNPHVNPENGSVRIYSILDASINRRVDLLLEWGDWLVIEGGHLRVLNNTAFWIEYDQYPALSPQDQVVGLAPIESAEKVGEDRG